MNLAIGLLLLLPFLTIIVSIHEFAHYSVARRFGFKIEQYFIGFGPKLWSTRRGEIEYGVKGIPGGGYVKIAGMNPYEAVAPEDLPRAYGSKPRWQRALVISAGPGVHFVVAAVIFAVWLMVSGRPVGASPEATTRVVVGQVQPALNGATSPAAAAGLRPGDVIIGVGTLTNPTPENLGTYVTQHVGEPLVYRVVRDGRTMAITMTPVPFQEKVSVGTATKTITIGRIGIMLGPERLGPAAALVGGIAAVGHAVTYSFQEIGHVFGPQGIGQVWGSLVQGKPRDPTGPASIVGIGQQVGSVIEQGFWGDALYFLGFLTVFIGLVNLIPLPPFDGGHLAVLAIEKIRGKAVDARKVVPVAVVVLGFFVVFVLATVLLDLTKPLPTP